MSDTNYAVRCNQVEKVFGTNDTAVRALRGVDWDVPFGEISMLVGQSGCGKTTLLSVITGLLDATGGTVEVLGEKLHQLNGHANQFRLDNIGFIFQQYNLLPALTAAENAAVPLFAANVPRREATERARDLLHKLGLGERADALPKQLSGGQQQRVAIARALINEPRLIVCDEPTAALDAESGRAVMELLHGVAVSPQRAVVVVTHDNRIFEFAHSITHMEDGRIVRRTNGNGSGGLPAGAGAARKLYRGVSS
jgi:putative ABC transport system ATP-binding protein